MFNDINEAFRNYLVLSMKENNCVLSLRDDRRLGIEDVTVSGKGDMMEIKC